MTSDFANLSRDDFAFHHLANYLDAANLAITNTYGRSWASAVAEVQRTPTRGVVSRAPIRGRIRELLLRGWNTELQLTIPLEHPELLDFANQWTVVQAYYAVHALAQVWHLLRFGCEAASHGALLNQLSGAVDNGQFPFPLSVGCQSFIDQDVIGITPPFQRTAGFVALRRPTNQTYKQHLFTTVKQTRENYLDEKKDGFLRKNPDRVRLSPDQLREWDTKIGTTTFFHLLYDMRRRANYLDSDVFLSSGVSDDDRRRFLEALRDLVSFVLFVFEVELAERVDASILQDALWHVASFGGDGLGPRARAESWPGR